MRLNASEICRAPWSPPRASRRVISPTIVYQLAGVAAGGPGQAEGREGTVQGGGRCPISFAQCSTTRPRLDRRSSAVSELISFPDVVIAWAIAEIWASPNSAVRQINTCSEKPGW